MRRNILIAALLALSACFGWWARGYLAVDACLDAGGMWVSHGGYCYGARPGG